MMPHLQSDILWRTMPFVELTSMELHDIWQLRQAIFVVEQDCPYLDIDGIDPICHHVMGSNTGTLVAYARLIPPKHKTAKIGRVVVHGSRRGNGLGVKVMQTSIEWILQHWDVQYIQLDAQSHLEHFYKKMGFFSTGHEFLEDGIPHIRMKMTVD